MRTFHEPCLLVPGDNLREEIEEADAAQKLALEVADALETNEAPSWLETSLVLGGFDDFNDFLDDQSLDFWVG
jgi:hypothetical protein